MLVVEPEIERPYATLQAEPGEQLAEIECEQIVAAYKAHGALLLRGFGVDITAFSAFTKRFCKTSVFNESRNRELLDRDGNIQSVVGGTGAMPLHPELSREPWKPDICFFCCLQPPSTGGETTICDGVALAQALPQPVHQAFAAHRLRYAQLARPDELRFWLGTETPSDGELASPRAPCPYRFERRADRRIERSFTRPGLHQPMFVDAPAYGNFLLLARDHLRMRDFPSLEDGSPVPDAWVAAAKESGEKLTAAIAWQRADILMLDNSRFMHGRRAIQVRGERRIASYFGYLDFAVPDADEVANAPWRRSDFRPPAS